MKPNNQYRPNRPNQGVRGAYRRTENNRNNSPRLGAQAHQRSDNTPNRRYQRKRPRNRSPDRSPKVARRSNSFEPPIRGRNTSIQNNRGRGNSQRRNNRPRTQSVSTKPVNKPQRSKSPSEKPSTGINMLVVPIQYPVTIMTEEQLDSLQTELLNSIDKIEDGAFRPQFLDCFKRKGTLTIDCFNQESVDWLKNTAPSLTPWEGAQLKVVEPGKVTQMVVVPDRYPLTVLTQEQLESLQTLILKIIDVIPEESFMPQFLKCFKQRGTLVLDCNNQESVEWLKDAIQNLISWEGPELNVLEPKDVPVLNMLSMWIPGTPESPEQVLERLERQNKGLRTKEWHFIDQKIEETGQVVMVSVDDSVLEALKNIDFRPFLNFTRVKVKHMGKFRPRVKKEDLKAETSEGQEPDGNAENVDEESKVEAEDNQNSEVEGEESNTVTEEGETKIEKTAAEENCTKAVNEKEMLLKELTAKNDSLSQLESMVDQLRGNQPDSVKLLATMESDKVAAARAVQQNKELKEQMESMQEVFLKMDNDKVELTEKLNFGISSNKELLEKLQKTELQLQRLTDAIEIKDQELSHLRESNLKLNKQILTLEQLSDRLRQYEAQDSFVNTLQHELHETKSTVVMLTNEINMLKSDKNPDKLIENWNKADFGVMRKQIDEVQLKNQLKQEGHTIFGNNLTESNIISYKEEAQTHLEEKEKLSDSILNKEEAMRHLEEKVKHTMQEIADLTEEKQRLEHLVMQLQGETETIGEYVALYQRQRMLLKQKALEKDQQLKQLDNDREQMKSKLEKLNALIRRLVDEKGSVPTEILEQHESLSGQSDNFCEEHTKIHHEIKKITNNQVTDANSKNSETAEKIIELLSEIKTSNLVQPSENFHHCPWCSGQLITV